MEIDVLLLAETLISRYKWFFYLNDLKTLANHINAALLSRSNVN